jgi:hypothetical protein
MLKSCGHTNNAATGSNHPGEGQQLQHFGEDTVEIAWQPRADI